MINQTKILLLIPAKALEHPQNPEEYGLEQKLRDATYRHHLYNNFEAAIQKSPDLPRIVIDKYFFNSAELGYNVIAQVVEK